MKTYIKVADACRSCGEGPVVIAYCKLFDRLFCFCMECDACWRDPREIETIERIELVDVCGSCEHLGAASNDQVKAAGWQQYATGNYDFSAYGES